MSNVNNGASNPRETIGWWLKWIRAAKKAGKSHAKDTKAAYDEYERMSRDSEEAIGTTNAMRGYPIYPISVKILEAAYYSKDPDIKSKRAYGIDDELALTMALISDRLGQYNVDHGHFSEAMYAASQDYIHGAKATVQVVYRTKLAPQRIPLNVMRQENPDGDSEEVFYDSDIYSPYEGDVLEDEDGYYYEGEEQVAVDDSQEILLVPAPCEEVLHTPSAKINSEITEIAYPFCLDFEEAEAKFNRNANGKSRNRKLPYKSGKDFDSDDDMAQTWEEKNEKPGRYLYGYECYCLKTKKIYWVCEDYKTAILAIEDDPWGLANFFPSPEFIISNKRRNSLYPTPTFVYLEATINQLHTLYYRIFRLIDSIKRRALVYGLSKELRSALNNLNGEEYISIGDMEGILEKGGIQNFVQFLPVQELVESLSEAIKIEEHFKALFYEWFRLPDIMRGVSDAQETLGAQELKTDNATDSYRRDKANIVKLARDAAEIMLDLSLRVYSDEKIARICGFDFLQPEHQARFAEALARLRDDKERLVRIDFETDSTSFRDDAKEIERQNLIAKTVLDGLAMIGRMENLQFMGVAIQTLLSVLEAIGGSTQTEDSVKKAVKALEEAKNQPPPPPPPDYEGLKVELKKQDNEIKAQSNQMNAAVKQRELDQKEFKLIQDEKEQQFEQQLASVQEQRAQEAQAFKQQLDAFQAKLDQALVAIEQQRVELEEAKGVIQAQETMLEENRLAKEVDDNKQINEADIIARVLETIALQTPEAPKEEPKKEAPMMPNITLVMGGKKKRHNFERDQDGNLISVESEEVD